MSFMSGQVFLGLTSTKQRIMCLAQGHNAVPPVRATNIRTYSHKTNKLRNIHPIEHVGRGARKMGKLQSPGLS